MLRRGRFEEAGTAVTPFPQTEGDGDDRIDGEGKDQAAAMLAVFLQTSQTEEELAKLREMGKEFGGGGGE